jgi:hypothetical protein
VVRWPDAHQATSHRPHNLPPEAPAEAKDSGCHSDADCQRENPRPTATAIDEAVTESTPAQPATITGPRIVTASRKTSPRFGPVEDIDAKEHQRRGDAAVELFRELARRATGDDGT